MEFTTLFAAMHTQTSAGSSEEISQTMSPQSDHVTGPGQTHPLAPLPTFLNMRAMACRPRWTYRYCITVLVRMIMATNPMA